jgi:hypothetical protein
MTNSILLDIYNDLESMTVSYLNKDNVATNPNCFDLNEIPASVQTAQLPCRILLPIGQGQGGSNNLQVLRGAGLKATWSITDLFLLETAARDAGLYIQAPVLMRYVVAYSEALGIKFQFVHGWNTESLTISASVIPGMYEYPAGSGTWYYGVKCDLTIEEIF